MPPYDYNDIRNQDWYNRLVRGVKEKTTASIRRAGADPNDPYWRAKEAQGLGDLSNARQDAFRRAFAAARERQMAYGARDRAAESNRQRIISAALKAQYRPDVGLGTQADETAPAGISSAIPEPIIGPTYADEPVEAFPRLPAPDVYERDRSAVPGGSSTGGGVYTNRAWAAGQAASGGYRPPEPPKPPVVAGYNPEVFKNKALEDRQKYLDRLVQQTAESLYSQRTRAKFTPGYMEGSPDDFYAQAIKTVMGR